MASISEPSTCHVFIYFWYLGPATLFWTLTLHVPYTWAWSNYYFQVLVVAGLGMLPILPKHLADRTCKLSLLGTILSSGYSLYSTYGVSTCLSEDWFFFLPGGTLIRCSFLCKETKSMEHASNSGLVTVCTCNQGFYPFNVLFYALHISIALKE